MNLEDSKIKMMEDGDKNLYEITKGEAMILGLFSPNFLLEFWKKLINSELISTDRL